MLLISLIAPVGLCKQHGQHCCLMTYERMNRSCRRRSVYLFPPGEGIIVRIFSLLTSAPFDGPALEQIEAPNMIMEHM